MSDPDRDAMRPLDWLKVLCTFLMVFIITSAVVCIMDPQPVVEWP